MMVFFPELYEDELAYSLFARYHVHSGHRTYAATAEDLFASRTVAPNLEFFPPLTEEVINVISKSVPMTSFAEKHTMLPLYTRFLPLERRTKAYDLLLAMDRTFYDCLYMRKDKTAMRKNLRYCPECAATDRQRYGEAYWHRKHQITGIDICADHFCRLEESRVRIAADNHRFSLVHAENVIPDQIAPDWSVSDHERKIAKYLEAVFDAPMDWENDATIGEFLHSKLGNTPYTSARGEVVYARKLYTDLAAHYESLPRFPIKAWWYVQKVFCGQNYHTLDICLIAMFLGIPARELIQLQKPEVPLHEQFDTLVFDLRSSGKTYAQVAGILGVSVDTVKSVGQRRYRSTKTI